MTEQTQTLETGGRINAESQTVPGTGNDSGEQKGSREARYRVERNTAREERDAALARIETLQTRELERIASKALSNPADLLTLSGKSLTDFLDEGGELDAELITETANEILASRPGLRPNQRAVDLTQGLGNGPVKPQISWADLLKS